MLRGDRATGEPACDRMEDFKFILFRQSEINLMGITLPIALCFDKGGRSAMAKSKCHASSTKTMQRVQSRNDANSRKVSCLLYSQDSAEIPRNAERQLTGLPRGDFFSEGRGWLYTLRLPYNLVADRR